MNPLCRSSCRESRLSKDRREFKSDVEHGYSNFIGSWFLRSALQCRVDVESGKLELLLGFTMKWSSDIIFITDRHPQLSILKRCKVYMHVQWPNCIWICDRKNVIPKFTTWKRNNVSGFTVNTDHLKIYGNSYVQILRACVCMIQNQFIVRYISFYLPKIIGMFEKFLNYH